MEKNFTKYRRTQIAEMRPITTEDIKQFETTGSIHTHATSDNVITVSISDVDKIAGSPKLGDMVARNPQNHLDEWLIAELYFRINFTKYESI